MCWRTILKRLIVLGANNLWKKNLDTDLCNELLTAVHVDTSIKSATLGRTKKQESIPEYGRPPVKVGGHRLAGREDAARRYHRAVLVAGRLLLWRRLLMNDVLTAVKTDQELAIIGTGRYLQMQWMLPGHSPHVASRAHTRYITRAQTSSYYIVLVHAQRSRIIVKCVEHTSCVTWI